MPKRSFLKIVVAVLFILFLITTLLIGFRHMILRNVFEALLNQSTQDFFAGSLQIDSVRLDPQLRIHIRGLKGNLQADSGPVPIEIQSLDSENAFFYLLTREGLVLRLEGFRPKNSLREGLHGICRLGGGFDWFLDLQLQVASLDFEDVIWFNPEYLSGSSGLIQGELHLKTAREKEPEFRVKLGVREPGGQIQSRFFSILTPYLPKSKGQTKAELKAISNTEALVGYKDIVMDMHLIESDKIKVFLHIAVPEYNLDLNVKMDIRLDAKQALMQVAQILGLVRIKVT